MTSLPLGPWIALTVFTLLVLVGAGGQPWRLACSAYWGCPLSLAGEVLDLIARGSGNAEISTRLYVSRKTVRNHISNVFTKLQVADRAQATNPAPHRGS